MLVWIVEKSSSKTSKQLQADLKQPGLLVSARTTHHSLLKQSFGYMDEGQGEQTTLKERHIKSHSFFLDNVLTDETRVELLGCVFNEVHKEKNAQPTVKQAVGMSENYV